MQDHATSRVPRDATLTLGRRADAAATNAVKL
jgi:hypothetical protein